MRAAFALAAVLAVGVSACGPGPGLPASVSAGLPPQDTLAGGLAPAPSTASGGSVATPAAPGAPWWSGGMALAGSSPSRTGGAAAGAQGPVGANGAAGSAGAAPATGGTSPTGEAGNVTPRASRPTR